MKTNFIQKAWQWLKSVFGRKTKLTDEIKEQDVFVKTKRPGRGAYFTNNRKRTRGRNIQYIIMPNGAARLIRHETI